MAVIKEKHNWDIQSHNNYLKIIFLPWEFSILSIMYPLYFLEDKLLFYSLQQMVSFKWKSIMLTYVNMSSHKNSKEQEINVPVFPSVNPFNSLRQWKRNMLRNKILQSQNFF